MAGRPLTPKQQRFVEEYPKDLNATQAWIRAGGSPASADVNGPRMLGNAGVKAAIDEALAARSKRTQVTVDQVVSEFASLAFRDPEGEPIPAAAEADTSGPGSYFVRRPRGAEFTYDHKLKALHDLANHLGMFVKKVAVEGKLSLEQLVAESLTDGSEDGE